jgi:hypothetical protein
VKCRPQKKNFDEKFTSDVCEEEEEVEDDNCGKSEVSVTFLLELEGINVTRKYLISEV